MIEKNTSLFLYAPGDARFEQVPIPVIENPHDVIIRIEYVGVCGSDVHFWKHGGMTHKVSLTNPVIMGHEASGTVVSVGSLVHADNLKPGDRVAIEPGIPCRYCEDCLTGHYNFCPDMRFAADPGPPATHGTLTKYFVAPSDFCYLLPDQVTLQEGVLIEPLAVAVHMARLVEVKFGDSVIVFGAGTVGLLAAAVAKAFGAKQVISVDMNEKRLEFARQFASTGTFKPETHLSNEENAKKLCSTFNFGRRGADVVIEATGAEPCIQMGIYALRKGGAFVQGGLGKAMINFPILLASEKELRIMGCFRYGPNAFKTALKLLQDGDIKVKDLITAEFSFEDAVKAWETTARGEGIKTLIRGAQD